MKEPSDSDSFWEAEREKIIGLGERSLRKTYYPELVQKLDELERFRALLDQSNDCIFLLKIPSLAFIDVNESACRQLGYTREQILAAPLEGIFPGEAARRVRELVAFGHVEGKDQDTITTQIIRSTGGTLPVEITIRLVAFHKSLYGVAVARDITERQRAERVRMENLRLLRDMELARQIQHSLLPTAPPVVSGVSLAGCCAPAAHVGGDYYDYFLRGTDVIDLVVADVSGHSIGAALMTALARSALRAQLASGGGPGEVLSALNRLLHEDLGRAELFITIFCASYDAPARTLRYANAGHVPPLLFRRAEPSCNWLDAEGLIIGVQEEVTFEEKSLQLRPGDLLLLYTDGVTEARAANDELFGMGRLCDIIGRNEASSPGEILDAVRSELTLFTGTAALEDDLTMVILKVD